MDIVLEDGADVPAAGLRGASSSSFFHAGCVELEIVVGAGIGLLENATFTLLASNAFVTSAAISCTFHFSFAKEETPPGVFVLSHAPCVAADAFGAMSFDQDAEVAVEAFVGFGRATLENANWFSLRISITWL